MVLRDVLPTDHVMAVNSLGLTGDQVALTSVLHQFQQPVCVTFEFLLQESEPGTSSTLSIYLLTKHHFPIRLRLEVSPSSFRAGWKQGCVYIQSGTYHVMFLATLGLPYYSDVYLDNIDFVLGDNYCCRDNSIRPTGNDAIFF